MKLTLERKAIKEAVAGLAKIIPKRTSLPVLGCVRITCAGDRCTLTATDLDQTLACRVKPVQAEAGGALLVPLEALNLLLKGADTEPVTFESRKKKELTIRNTVGTQEVARTFEVLDPEDWPAESPAADVGVVDPAFLTNFRKASLFASTDTTRLILNGVYLHPDAKEGDHLVATDGRRLGAFNTIKLPFNSSCVVPTTKFLLWPKLVSEELLIGCKQEKEAGWFRLVTPLWDYRCRTVAGTYPNWKMVADRDNGGAHGFHLSETDAELLKKILPTFAGHDAHNQPVKFDLREGRTHLVGRGENDQQESRLELTDTRSVGKPGTIRVDRNYLLDALNAGFRDFSFEDELSPLHSRSADGGIHVVMPLRTDATPRPVAAPPAPQAAETGPTTTPTSKQKEEPMKTETNTAPTTTQPTAHERILAAYEMAKTKVREANEALALVAVAVKDALREDRARRQEVEAVRTTLAKLQAIKV